MSAASSPAPAPSSARRWIHGPALDLLLGCGGLYALVFAIFPLVAGTPLTVGANFVAPLLVLLISVPHYGGTLLRVYETRAERRKYTFFTVYATLALFAWFVYGVYDLWVGSLMMTLYLSWSPWHYSGQNYGIALMFMRRRGVTVSTVAKRAFYASFVLSFLLALLVMHGTRGGAYESAAHGVSMIEFIPLGLPVSWVDGLTLGVLGLYGASLLVAASMLLRSGSLRDLAPAGLMVLTQALWFIAPFTARQMMAAAPEAVGARYILDSMMWVAIAHAAQYLWITSYYARGAGAWSGFGAYFTKVMMSGSLIWTIPLLLFAPWALGTHPFGAGLVFLVAAFVNLHHFVLDGAIWKLRDGPVASLLIRDRSDGVVLPEPIGTTRRSWLRRGLWTAAAVCVGVQALISLRADIGFAWAMRSDDAVAAERVLQQTEWVGGDTAQRRLQLAHWYRRQGNADRAVAQLERGLRGSPRSALLLRTLGEIQVEGGEFEAGLASAEGSLAQDEGDPRAHLVAGTALSRLGRYPEAIVHLKAAIARDGGLAQAHASLGNALLETDRVEDAVRHYSIALHLQPETAWVRQRLEMAKRRMQERRFDGFFVPKDS